MRERRGTPRTAPPAAPGTARGPVRPGPGGRRRGAHAGPPAREDRTESGRGPADTPRTLPAGLRPRTVRARIVALLMVPVVSVMALWAFATVTTAGEVRARLQARTIDAALLRPVEAAAAGLQAERAAAGQLLATPGAARESALREAAAATDRAVTPLALGPGYNRADAEGLGPEAAARVDALTTAVAALPDLRLRVLTRNAAWPEVYAAYGTAVDRALDVAGALTALRDDRAASDARVLLEFARSRELLAREDALLRAGQAAGRLAEDQHRDFAATVYARRLFERTSAADLRPADRTALQAVAAGADYQDLLRLEDAVRNAEDGKAAVAAVGADRWAVSADGVARALRTVSADAATAAAERSRPSAMGLSTPSGAAVLLGLAAVLASLLISVRIGSGLVAELTGLRNSALELAGRTLPATMRRLRAGEEVDPEADAPRQPPGEDEIGQVHGALETVRRAAVTAAVERAEVLSGVSGVFVNLARRSQVLVHRQLTLLDAMERRTEDPAELDDLFRLDHLTTRMRRHAEGLIILSGATPGRAWRRPVPLTDVVRAAVAEVEEYARVELHRMPRAAVGGHAVADLTHLIAELVENATGFSPPHTRVHIRGEQVGNGYALEIEDRGLGMGPEALADANRRIGAAEQLDLFDSDRLGLFVVSRLARRHQVRVALRPSAYGGTTAVVLLPTALLQTGADAEPEPVTVPAPAAVPPPAAVNAPEPVAAPAAAEPPVAPGLPAVPPGVRPIPFPGPARPVGPPSAVPASGTAAGTPAGPAAGETDGRLPRRVRQASLVPQLREAPARPQPRPRAAATPAGRSPEEARAAMSAFQQGWARGKEQRPSTFRADRGESR
ncbi:nitrate- and nitrite sensing domain-containing protein [Kitasatospora camelliae]|uniref:histidine kinase n=1 Tax=Kitasatospora camelliae TaxID=3156397 RepID=A0AAU8K4R2_9ACTN